MLYADYRYLYPPRPSLAIAPATIRQCEDWGWLAQAKMNGTCAVIYVAPDRTSIAMGRHGPTNRLDWQPGERWNAFARSLPGQGWYVFVGELLHSKVRGGPRDTVYLFDILVSDGEYLVGKKLALRYNLLNALCGFMSKDQWEQTSYYRVVSDGVWLASNRYEGFGNLFMSISDPAVEGLVLKSPESPLMLCARQSSNDNWQVKCRYAKANLSF